jgi:hypothetical protein
MRIHIYPLCFFVFLQEIYIKPRSQNSISLRLTKFLHFQTQLTGDVRLSHSELCSTLQRFNKIKRLSRPINVGNLRVLRQDVALKRLLNNCFFFNPHNQCFKIHFKIALQFQLRSQNGLSPSGGLTEMYAFLISPVRATLKPILSALIWSCW